MWGTTRPRPPLYHEATGAATPENWPQRPTRQFRLAWWRRITRSKCSASATKVHSLTDSRPASGHQIAEEFRADFPIACLTRAQFLDRTLLIPSSAHPQGGRRQAVPAHAEGEPDATPFAAGATSPLVNGGSTASRGVHPCAPSSPSAGATGSRCGQSRRRLLHRCHRGRVKLGSRLGCDAKTCRPGTRSTERRQPHTIPDACPLARSVGVLQ